MLSLQVAYLYFFTLGVGKEETIKDMTLWGHISRQSNRHMFLNHLPDVTMEDKLGDRAAEKDYDKNLTKEQ